MFASIKEISKKEYDKVTVSASELVESLTKSQFDKLTSLVNNFFTKGLVEVKIRCGGVKAHAS
jgi:citrate lyase synthetase